MRTIVDFPPLQKKALKTLAQEQKLSVAELVRRAVDRYLQEVGPGEASYEERCFGLWKNRGIDGLQYESTLRKEWER